LVDAADVFAELEVVVEEFRFGPTLRKSDESFGLAAKRPRGQLFRGPTYGGT